MRVTVRSAVEDIKDKAFKLYLIRVGTCLALLIAFYGIALFSGFRPFIEPLLVIGAVEFLVNFPYPFYFKNAEKAYKFLAASIMVDFMIETLGLHFIGGIEAMFFSAMYLITILYCAFNLPSTFTFMMATLASFLYTGLIAAEYYDVIPHYITTGIKLNAMQQAATVMSHVAFFYLIAFFAKFLSDALDKKEVQLQGLLDEVREAHQKIKSAHRTKSQFLADMSHELRSPLNSMRGLAELLLDPAFGPLNEKQKHYAEMIERNSKHLIELVTDLLDVSKIEAEKAQMNWRQENLSLLVRHAAEVFESEAKRRGIALSVGDKTGHAISVLLDPLKMKQILYNLLSNALKFTPSGGRVHIGLEKRAGEILLTVTDTGIGLPPDEHERIFEAYQQAHLRPDEPGTGLGLFITKRFVEMHGGHIRAESPAGGGARFIVSLPADGPKICPPLERYQVPQESKR